MDGLLLDTEKIYTEVTTELAARYGKTFTMDLKFRMMGRKSIEAAELLVYELGMPISAEEYLEEQKESFQIKFPLCSTMPGIEPFCFQLSEMNIPMAVATSSTKYWFSYKTQNHESLFSLFDAIVTGDHPDVKAGKPSPDIFLVTADILGVKPEDCVVFEDSLLGIEAAKKAGMSAIAIPDPLLDQAHFHKADLVLAEISEFSIKHFTQSII